MNGCTEGLVVDGAETVDPDAAAARFPKREYFIMGVNLHLANDVGIGFRNLKFAKNMGVELGADGFSNFVKEMFSIANRDAAKARPAHYCDRKTRPPDNVGEFDVASKHRASRIGTIPTITTRIPAISRGV